MGRYRDGEHIKIGGMITSLKRSTTKKGNSVIYFTVEDKRGSVDVIYFPKNALMKLIPERGFLGVVEGRLSIQDESYRIFGEGVKPLETVPVNPDHYLYIRINSYAVTPEILEKLRVLLAQHQGINPVLLYFVEDQALVQAGPTFGVEMDQKLIYLIEELCGPGSCYYLSKDSAYLAELITRDSLIS